MSKGRLDAGSYRARRAPWQPGGPQMLTSDHMRGLLERLAALEHEQWAHWTRYMMDNLNSENIERWTRQCAIPYEDLSEVEKESDREWARKVMVLLRGCED